MSIDTTHVAIAGEQQLQQMVGNPDPRISIPAAARLAKMIQERKSQQSQQALAAQPQPTVRDQLQQAAAPAPAPAPQETGIAMAAGGMVQRHFWGGGDASTGPNPDVYNENSGYNASVQDQPDDTSFELARKAALRAQAYRAAENAPLVKPDSAVGALLGSAWDKLKAPFTATPYGATTDYSHEGRGQDSEPLSGIAADFAARQRQRQGASTPAPNPKAPTPPPAQPGAGLQHAISTETLSSGPVNTGKVAAVSQDTGTPEDTHMQAANELLEQLSPLQKQLLEQMSASKSAEEARYKALQAAKHDPNAFVDSMNRIVEITRPFANARVGVRGNLGALLEGSHELSTNDQAARTQQAKEEALHQQTLAGITTGMTQQQIKDLMGNYGVKNTAMTNDDKQTIAEQQAAYRQSQLELAQAKATEAQRVDNARIQKLTGGAGGAGGAGGTGKPMTEQQHQQYARQQAALEFSAAQKRIAAGSDEALPDLAALAQKHYTLSKQFQPTPVQSGAPAAPTARLKYNPATGKIE